MANHTDGQRIYAIGDIHGCLDQLVQVQSNIQLDLIDRPHANPVIVYLGDYIDRGPDSRGVIDNLIAEAAATHQTRFLFGNHDEMLLTYRTDPLIPIRPKGPLVNKIHWLHRLGGGAETLRSYGVKGANDENPTDKHAAFINAFPEAHLEFFNSLETFLRFGSYFFVHAGINPDASLEDQTLDNLIWMREPFLSSTRDFGVTVVHGHTPVKEVENHGNRIAIDTGAVFNGTLSCLVVENTNQSLLTDAGLVPFPPN